MNMSEPKIQVCCGGMFAERNYEASQWGSRFGKDSKKFVTTWPCVRKERMEEENMDSLAMPKQVDKFKRETAPEKNSADFTAYQYVKYEPNEHAEMSFHLVWHVRTA